MTLHLPDSKKSASLTHISFEVISDGVHVKCLQERQGKYISDFKQRGKIKRSRHLSHLYGCFKIPDAPKV